MRMGVLVAGLVAIAAGLGCGETTAVSCSDGTFCPAGTVCEAANGRCLVEADSCADFGVNAPCLVDDGPGFCAAASCVGAVLIEGQIREINGDDVVGGSIVALDRPWMDTAPVPIGSFSVPAVRGDSDLVLRLGADGFIDTLTREVTLGDDDFVFNEDPNEPLILITEARRMFYVQQISGTFSSANGSVAVRVMTGGGQRDLPAATGALVGGAGPEPRPLYFEAGISGDPDLVATSTANGRILFPEVEPGAYEVQIGHPQDRVCRAAGDPDDPEPRPIKLVVEANTLTVVGSVFCRTAN